MSERVIRRVQLIKGGTIIKQGETFTLGFRLFDANDRIIQLESADVVTVKIANRTGVIKEVTASKVDDYIEFTVNESIGYGEMRVELTVTNGTSVQKYPARDWIQLTITQSLDDAGAGGIQALTVQQFRQEFDEAVGALTQDSEVALARDGETILGKRLDRDKQELSTKLAEKAEKAEVRKNTDLQPINVDEMDTETKLLFTGGAVAVVGEKMVGNENLKLKAVDYKTQRLIEIDHESNLKYTVTDDGVFKFEWINYVSKAWGSAATERSVINPIKKKSQITITTIGAHDRFTVFTSKNATYSEPAASFKQIFVKNGDGVSQGNETYTFYNENDSYLIIGITSGSQKPTVKIEQVFSDRVAIEVDKIKANTSVDSPPLTNEVRNGDFGNNLTDWTSTNGSLTLNGGVARFLATAEKGLARQLLTRTAGEVFYIRGRVKSSSASTGITVNGTIPENLKHSGSGSFETLSAVYTAPSTSNWNFGVQDDNKATFSPIDFDDMIVISLTDSFGAGSEPTKSEMDKLFADYIEGGFFNGTVENYASIIKDLQNLRSKVESAPSQGGTGIDQVKEVHPVMFGVKMSNERDKSRGYAETPRPVGWLYYHPETFDLYYATGDPENMKYLCGWNMDVTWNGTSKPEHYRPFITRDGDVIFVWRGDLLGLESNLPNVRQNPIVYPAGDWNNPAEVDLGTGEKPTAWLQNCGADFIYNQNIFMFSEYTRPSHINSYVWKVTKPFTDPANWRIVKTFLLSGSNGDGMKHCHTINYDPFSGLTYLTTGDDDDAAKIFSSSDYGETWNLELEGQRKYARVLNFVFTKDKVYWANDDSLHGFYSIDRDANSVPIFSNITELYDLTGNPPTYVNCLIDDPNGILILDRWDGATTQSLKVHFWHIPSGTMHVVKEIYPTENIAKTFGFRVEAANFYQAKGSTKIVTGFGNPKNDMALVGNTAYALNKDRINNLVLEVVPSGQTFELKVSAINDRT